MPLHVSINVLLLEDTHFAAHLVDPHCCPRDVSPILHRFRSYLMQYFASAVERAYAISEGKRNPQPRALQSQDLCGILPERYMQISGVCNDENNDPGNDDVFKEFSKMPMV